MLQWLNDKHQEQQQLNTLYIYPLQTCSHPCKIKQDIYPLALCAIQNWTFKFQLNTLTPISGDWVGTSEQTDQLVLKQISKGGHLWLDFEEDFRSLSYIYIVN